MVDVNGWVMSQSLPYGGFKWVDPNIDVLSIGDESSKGYILEVDLEYPNHLHDAHKDLPFCPEHSAPPRCKNLMNNAVFGKTMEDIRKHSTVKLVNKWSGRYGAEALISKPEFKAATIFNENLAAIELLNPEFDDDCSALYTDTDSLIYEIRNRDPYEIIRHDCHSRFDTSDYPANNGYNIPQVNKKVFGMMKDEFNGTPIELFVGLRSKMNTVKRAGSSSDNIKKVKGIKKSVIKNVITLEDYFECVDNFKEKVITQNLIKSEKHQVYSMMQEKIALKSLR
ncbi:hypothetical protein NQ315_000588 [Exocentrus adspersus]|uniref:DNA-directed DNA polymerase n=1 Tax=Exocentrus adspersus TaxID=1586481 RepID=A0AAV8VDL4_9CUCU|nr:hypothetical protein NQ315_000588 [Exocentrus adspersus]